VQRGQSPLLSVVPSDRTKGNGQKLTHRRFCLYSRKHFVYWEGDRALAQNDEGGCRVSVLGDIQKPSGRGPRQLAIGGPA